MTDGSEPRARRGEDGLEPRSPVPGAPGPDPSREEAHVSFFRLPERGEPVSLPQFLFWKAVALVYFALWAGALFWAAAVATNTPLRVLLFFLLLLTTPSLHDLAESYGSYVRRRRDALRGSADEDARAAESSGSSGAG